MALVKDYKSKISPKNQAYADKIREYVKKYSIVGIVDVTGLPAPQFQRIRAKLKKTAEILIVKNNLISLVFNELKKSNPGLVDLCSKSSGVVGLVFTNDNPFTLYKFIKKNKSSAPAKGGQIAPNDIVVPAGPTSFAPGPIIGELGALKIKAGIADGKVEIKADSLVAKEGDEISLGLASVLSRLGIEPMEVGLNLKALVEDGTLYDKSVLDVDEDAILADLQTEALRAFQLSIGLNYHTKENITHFLGEAGRDSLGLGVGVAWPAAETIKKLVSKANAQMAGLGSSLPEDLRPAGVVVESSASAPVAEEASASPANEGNKKEEKPEDAAAGLAGLF